MISKIRIAIVVSHPIQHFCPQYVSFTKNESVHCRVFFASSLGYKTYKDVNFQKEISWSNLQLDKFEHHFLNEGKVIQPDKNLDAPELEKELEAFKPSIVFTYGYFQKLQRRTYKWAVKNRVPLAYISDSELRHKRNQLKEFFKSAYLRNYFRKIDYFLTMGDANEAYYLKHGVPKSKLLRMHYPIDWEAYKKNYLIKEQLRNNIRQQYEIAEDAFVLTVVGKLVSWKNQDHIIGAMKLLETEGIYGHLFILGSGAMKEEWESKAKELKHSKAHLTGFVNIDTLPAYYAAADVYVHPASLEPHSVAISEAIMMGLPIILSDRCGSYGATDDVQINKNGLVYKFGNIKELAAQIKSLIQDEPRRKAFAKHSHKLALSYQENSHVVFLNKLVSRLNSANN